MLSYLLACPWELIDLTKLRAVCVYVCVGGGWGVTCINVFKPPQWNWTIKGLYYLLRFFLILGWAHGTHWEALTSGYFFFFLQSLTSTLTQSTQVSLSLWPCGHIWYSAPFWPNHMILQSCWSSLSPSLAFPGTQKRFHCAPLSFWGSRRLMCQRSFTLPLKTMTAIWLPSC